MVLILFYVATKLNELLRALTSILSRRGFSDLLNMFINFSDVRFCWSPVNFFYFVLYERILFEVYFCHKFPNMFPGSVKITHLYLWHFPVFLDQIRGNKHTVVNTRSLVYLTQTSICSVAVFKEMIFRSFCGLALISQHAPLCLYQNLSL